MKKLMFFLTFLISPSVGAVVLLPAVNISTTNVTVSTQSLCAYYHYADTSGDGSPNPESCLTFIRRINYERLKGEFIEGLRILRQLNNNQGDQDQGDQVFP